MFKGFRGFRSDVSEKVSCTSSGSDDLLKKLEKEVILSDPESYIDRGKCMMAFLEEECEQEEKLGRELTEKEIEELGKLIKEKFIRKILADYGWSYNDYLAEKRRQDFEEMVGEE